MARAFLQLVPQLGHLRAERREKKMTPASLRLILKGRCYSFSPCGAVNVSCCPLLPQRQECVSMSAKLKSELVNCSSDELKHLPPSGAPHCPTKPSACVHQHFSYLGFLPPRNLES